MNHWEIFSKDWLVVELGDALMNLIDWCLKYFLYALCNLNLFVTESNRNHPELLLREMKLTLMQLAVRLLP